jgi:amino acid transporter
MPEWLTINYRSASAAFRDGIQGEGFQAWINAPKIGSLRVIFDLPAFMINVLVTWLVYVGVNESRKVSNFMVLLKLFIIVVVIVTGAFFIDIDNWTPFMPNGFGGVMGGAAAVFFAYIGFDAVSTLAEESKNPMRDLPKGMMYSLMICTVVYVLLALVLTGMVSYNALGVSDPLAEVFKLKGVKWMLYFVSIAAVVAMTSVILVFQLGQPRIWMSMARDGLLPKRFAKIHPKYKTPGFSTIMTGAVVGIPIFFTDETFVLDFTSIGTLFAFVLVCGGVLLLPKAEKVEGVKQRFRLPHINGKWIVPAIVVAAFALLLNDNSTYTEELFQFNSTNLSAKLPMWIFLLLCLIMATMSFLRNLSLIPVLGVLSCCYLLTGMAPSNWLWFGVWLLIGLVVYLLYGFRKSKLAQHS